MNEPTVTPLGRKISAAIIGITLLALGLFFLLNSIPVVYKFRVDAVDNASSLADLMSASLAASVDFEDPQAAREDLAALSFTPGVKGAAIFLEDGTVFASYSEVPRRVAADFIVVETTFSELTVAAPIPSETPGAVVVLTESLDGQWGLLKGYAVIGLVILVGVFLLCIRLAGSVRRKLGDPLHELTQVVHDISQSRDYSRRVEHESDDEIGVLVAEFNSMLEKIEYRDGRLSRHQEVLEQRVEERTVQLQAKQLELLKNNRSLFLEIKKRAQAEMIKDEVERINRHDLKSGLSLVIGYPELLLKEGDLTRRQELLIKRIRSAGYRMLDMIRNHLDMFKMEKGVYMLSMAPVDLVEILCELEEEFMPLLASSDVRLVLAVNSTDMVGDESFSIIGEAPLVRTMCRNLVQNAIEASSPGQTVSVMLDDRGQKVMQIINAVAVPPEIRRRFFDKYVTQGKENGTGLGTYHAALIAKTHGADISMKTDDQSGTSLKIVFKERSERTILAIEDEAKARVEH